MATQITARVVFIIAALMTFSQTQSIARYQAQPLCRLKSPETQKSSQLSFNYLIFDKNDCKKYLGRKQIIDRGYQPIQIQIINNTCHSLQFSPENVSLPCISFHDVIEDVRFNTGLRLCLWGVGTLVIFFLIVPFVLDAIESPKANELLDADYQCKTVGTQVIEPQSTLEGILFVPSEQFNGDFSFFLTNKSGNQRYELSTAQPVLTMS